MFDRIRPLILRWARVPAEPHPPLGAPASLRVFRAGRNQYRLSIVPWVLAQVLTLVGILFSLQFLAHLKEDLQDAPPTTVATIESSSAEAVTASADSGARRASRHMADQVRPHVPRWVLPLLIVGEALGIAAYLLQLPVTFAALRLEWEMRWYMVTDRSLRIRSGIFTVKESTMSFANLQQVEVTQGPLQRLLGLADVRVQSAGGGGGGGDAHGKGKQGESLHTGIFHGVEHAAEIRDLILERLRRFRATGLGDPDDHPEHHPDDGPPPLAVADTSAVAAARELLAEARALRQALQ